jgi:hypothetical protein
MQCSNCACLLSVSLSVPTVHVCSVSLSQLCMFALSLCPNCACWLSLSVPIVHVCSLSLSLCARNRSFGISYIYIYMCVCLCVYVCMLIFMLMQSVDNHFHIDLTLVGKARAYPCYKPQIKANMAMFSSVKHSSLLSQREQYADKKVLRC